MNISSRPGQILVSTAYRVVALNTKAVPKMQRCLRRHTRFGKVERLRRVILFGLFVSMITSSALKQAGGAFYNMQYYCESRFMYEDVTSSARTE